jgi:hypothetical protein
MKYKAALLSFDVNFDYPTSKELKLFLGKSAKLLYGNDKRITKNTPYRDKLHFVTNAFRTFQHLFFPDSLRLFKLYIFNDKIYSSHFLLKYSPIVITLFELDDTIVEDLHKVEWDYGHLTRHKKQVRIGIDGLDFFIERGVGSKGFHDAFPSHTASTNEFIQLIDNELKQLEHKAYSIFNSGW